MNKLLCLPVVLLMFTSGCTFITNLEDSRSQSVMRTEVYNDLVGVENDVAIEAYSEALVKLSNILAKQGNDLTSHERANIFNYYGYIYDTIGKNRLSIDYYQKVLDERNIPNRLKRYALNAVAIVYFEIGEYEKTVDSLAGMDCSLTVEQHLMLAYSHFYTGNIDGVIRNLDLAESKVNESGDLSVKAVREYRAQLVGAYP